MLADIRMRLSLNLLASTGHTNTYSEHQALLTAYKGLLHWAYNENAVKAYSLDGTPTDLPPGVQLR